MLSNRLITFFKSNSWWFDDTTTEYEQALRLYNLDLTSDFAKFYLHVEDGPTFSSRSFELLHLPWFIINSDFKLLVDTVKSSLQCDEDLLPITNLEAQSCFFYNKKKGNVILLKLSQSGIVCGKEIGRAHV